MEIGEIAAAAAGDQDLGADLVGMLEQQDFAAALAGRQGAHESGCTGSQYDDVERPRRCRHSPLLTCYRQARSRRTKTLALWRRGRDVDPRYGFPYAAVR